MIEKRCRRCNNIIIKDWEKWLIENENQNYFQCPFCLEMQEKLE